MTFGILEGLVGGALSYAGAREANKANQRMAREQMKFQRESAGEQMAFQERMSNTAYQRAMKDMQSAGLNPILAFNQGGASTPGGAMASGATAHMSNKLGAAASSAIGARRAHAEMENLKVQNSNIKSQTELNNALAKSAFEEARLKSNSAVKVKSDMFRQWFDTAKEAGKDILPYLLMLARRGR